MFKGSGLRLLLVLLAVSLAVTGCATTRNYQGDIDALNAKVSTLEGQLSEKEAELAKLQNQVRDEENARQQAENEKRALSEKLEDALAERAAAKTAKATKAVVIPDSDLK